MKGVILVLAPCCPPVAAFAQQSDTNADLANIEVPGAYTNQDQKRLTHPRMAKGLSAATATLLFLLTLGTASPIQADTFPATGTAGFETGLHDLAFVTLDKGGQSGLGARVDWGDNAQSPGLYRCFEPTLHPNKCHVFGTHRYAAPGIYTITIIYNEPRVIGTGPEVRETTTATISPIGDFVILSIGDSIASGEGDPVVEYSDIAAAMQPNHAFWDDFGSNYDLPGEPQTPEDAEMRRPCHRSLISGTAQASQRIKATNPTSFVHFACSGATVKTTTRNVSNAVSQLKLARSYLPRIDVLLISAGANNMHFTKPSGEPGSGFGDVLLRCLRPGNNCSNDPLFEQDISDSLAELPGEYAKLNQEIHCIDPDSGTHEPNCTDPRNQIPKLVLITEYMDPTHVERVDNPNEDGFPGVGCLDAGIRENEWKFLYNHIVVPLNQRVRNSPWHAVVGMQDDFMAHGYCAGSQRWIVTGPDSEAALGGGPIVGAQGTGHPNADGHGNYRDRIYNTMVALNPPVTTATATAGGRPYSFDTWTARDVQVTLAARNPISESGVGRTYFAVDNPACAPPAMIGCSLYTGPFVIRTSGTHTVSFYSENQFGAFEAVSTVVVRIDKNPPRMACGGTPLVLWPPNGKMVPVTTTVKAVDEVSGPVPFVLTSVRTSEGNATADIQGFVVGGPDTGGLLRARRSGSGPGRKYTLIYEAADELGNTGSCTVVVTVPHDQRGKGR